MRVSHFNQDKNRIPGQKALCGMQNPLQGYCTPCDSGLFPCLERSICLHSLFLLWGTLPSPLHVLMALPSLFKVSGLCSDNVMSAGLPFLYHLITQHCPSEQVQFPCLYNCLDHLQTPETSLLFVSSIILMN